MDQEWRSSHFNSVGIFWRPEDSKGIFAVRATWQGGEFLRASVGPLRPTLPFSLDAEDGSGKPFLAGQFSAEEKDGSWQLFLDLDYPEGRIRKELLSTDFCPPALPESIPEVEELQVQEEGFGDLFPYLFIRPWPGVDRSDLENRFVRYPGEGRCTNGSSSLYCQLVALRTAPGARKEMEDRAVAFIEGNPQHGFEGQFLGSLDGLSGPLRWFSSFDELVRKQPGLELSGFRAELKALTGMTWDQIREYVLEPAGGPFSTERDRAWQNLFALTITLGYDRRLLEGLLQTVIMASLVERIARSEEVGSEWTPVRIQEGATATVILPADVFPLPPATPVETSPETPDPSPLRRWPRMAASGDDGGIEPYAVGDLKMVQQRLLGYSLGEVSSIENILQGEQKEKTQRRLTRREEEMSSEQDQGSRQESRSRTFQAELTAAVQETLSQQFKYSYQTQYGPPTGNDATGFLQLQNAPGSSDPMSDGNRQTSRFAREIASRTAQLITRRVLDRRSLSLLQEDEETVVHRFDATGSGGNLRGIYRWVNKVYSLRVVGYGHRLLLEILVDRPAAGFIGAELALTGQPAVPPVSPQELGLRSPMDISTDPQSDLYWMKLVARYGALDVQPPPSATLTATLSLQGGDVPVSQEIGVAEGYQASQARLALSGGSSGLTVSGLVGLAAFTLSPGGGPQTLPMSRETSAVPVAVAATATPAAGGGTGGADEPATPAGPGFVLNIELETRLTSRRLEEWQLRTYQEILAAYDRQKERYFGLIGVTSDGTERRNPLWYRETERRELTRDVLRQLLQQAGRLVGASGSGTGGDPSNFQLAEPARLQFLETCFEWGQMTYSFNVLTPEPGRRGEVAWALQRFPGADSLFSAFLQAVSARILLPVRPGFDLTVLYSLASGMIWPCADVLTPAHSGSVPLINDLKNLALQPRSAAPPDESWEITVPTSMVLLQDGPDLPSFPEEKGECSHA